jgi:DDE superfamily endonuclease
MATRWQSPQDWSEWVDWLSSGLHGRCRWRLPLVISGMLFAKGRRTVTTWLRAAGIVCDFSDYYYFIASVGRNTESLATLLLELLLRVLPGNRVLLGLDDTPTKRYGPKVQGAGLHYNPTPGPADQKYLYGHIWVTLAWIVRHRWWGTIGLPLRALLYIRQKDIVKLPRNLAGTWKFQTKLILATHLVEWAAPCVLQAGKRLWLAVDGSYAKRPFLRPAIQAGAVVVSRLRKDAYLRDLPPRLRANQRRKRGRPRTYGKNRIDLAKRAGQKKGWQTITCTLYGRLVTRTYKTFLATYRPVGGVIRVVIVKETQGWVPLFCTDLNASVAEILEAFADRSAIEQDFHDLKEVWGTGQQQVRNLWANIGVFHLNLWVHTLVELWAWDKPKRQLCNRQDSPWDDPERRPSHADRRKALREQCIQEEFLALPDRGSIPQKIRTLFRRLKKIAA